MTFVTGPHPSMVNSKLLPDNVRIQTRTVFTPEAVTIPPYSVGRLEWCALPRGGPGYLDREIGDGSALCGDHEDADEGSR